MHLICWSDFVCRTKFPVTVCLVSSSDGGCVHSDAVWRLLIWSVRLRSVISFCSQTVASLSHGRIREQPQNIRNWSTLIYLQHPSWAQRARLSPAAKHSWWIKVLKLRVPSLTVWASLWFVDFKLISDFVHVSEWRSVTGYLPLKTSNHSYNMTPMWNQS